jgi:DNA integrity scanning protein DisA with diadenylate cyclase activity
MATEGFLMTKTLQDLSFNDLVSLKDTLTLLKREEMIKEIKQEITRRIENNIMR